MAMRILAHLEPIPFRGSTNFIECHLGAFIEPILEALATSSQNKQIFLGISTNIFLCLKSLAMIRRLAKKYQIHPALYPVYSNKILTFYGNSSTKYCRDIYSRKEEIEPNADLLRFFYKLFSDFCPDLVITTSDNRYLQHQCREADIPLLSCEFGPLPRSLYPENRFLNVGGHLNTELLSSVRNIKRQLSEFAPSKVLGEKETARFVENYLACQKNNSDWPVAERFFCQFKGKRIALLALQPRDWVTWEGALGISLKPSEIILKALSRMQADILIVTFHSDRSGDIAPDVFSEIWLSDKRLEKLPESLAHGSSELLLPFVNEVLSVSSNTAFTAFLLNKEITPISNSWVKVLSRIQRKFKAEINEWRASIYHLFVGKYFVDNSVFQHPDALAMRVIEMLRDKDFNWPPVAKDASEAKVAPPFVRYSPRTLAEVHEAIRLDLKENGSIKRSIRLFGRNALGYLVKDNAVGVELGVASGYFSESVLRTGKFKKLFSIDRWHDHHDNNEYGFVVNRLSEFGDQSVILRKTFDEAIEDFSDQSIDFIYIDGYAHKGDAAEILAKWHPKLKPGAIVAGHDYCNRFWPENFKSINSMASIAKGNSIQTAPGVLTENDEDIIPSFYFWIS